MNIQFMRTGGFAGLRLTAQFDTSDLPGDQVDTLEKLISDADFFALPERLLQERPVPDRFEYQVTVVTTERTHSVTVSEAAAPESLRPLLNCLTTLAMVDKRR